MVFMNLYTDTANTATMNDHIIGYSAIFNFTHHIYEKNITALSSNFLFLMTYILYDFYTENPGVSTGCIRPLDDPHLTIDYQHY